MNLQDLQDFLEKLHPNKQVILSFDEQCIAKVECAFKEGLPYPVAYCHFCHVKVNVEDLDPQYMGIDTQVGSMNWVTFKETISSKVDVYLEPLFFQKMRLLDLAENNTVEQIELMESEDRFEILELKKDLQRFKDEIISPVLVQSGYSLEQLQSKYESWKLINFS